MKGWQKGAIIGSVIVAIGIIAGTGAYVHRVDEINSQYNTLRLSSPQTESSLPAQATNAQKEQALKSAKKPITDNDIKLNYEKAHAECSSVVGWIYIPGTDINYPVDYNPNSDDYYLTHNWKNQPFWNGTPFLDYRNKGFDSYTLINGHNMLNGVIFAQLLKYESLDHAKRYPYIYLYEGLNQNCLKKFQVIGSVYVPDNVPLEVGGLNKQDRTDEVNRLMSNKIYQLNQYNGNDVLMLNTCLSNGTNNHLLVLTQLVNN